MPENGDKRFVTNKELKDELDKRPTKYEVLFYIAAATVVGRFIPPDPVAPVTGAVLGVFHWIF